VNDEERIVIHDKRKIRTDGALADTGARSRDRTTPGEPVTEENVTDKDVTGKKGAGDEARPGPFAAELAALRDELDERTRDLQRVTAEYANYRKRVDRDKGLVTEQATATVLAGLLPFLDDLDRARDHGDLTGPFGAVADALGQAVAKFGLAPFGEKGDRFDPMRHEAVAHLLSAEVTEPTCVDVLRRGYMVGDRLLRPALVAVADPAEAIADKGDEPAERSPRHRSEEDESEARAADEDLPE